MPPNSSIRPGPTATAAWPALGSCAHGRSMGVRDFQFQPLPRPLSPCLPVSLALAVSLCLFSFFYVTLSLSFYVCLSLSVSSSCVLSVFHSLYRSLISLPASVCLCLSRCPLRPYFSASAAAAAATSTYVSLPLCLCLCLCLSASASVYLPLSLCRCVLLCLCRSVPLCFACLSVFL